MTLMLNSKPAPLLAAGAAVRRLCPICGSIAYSVAGVHPQCAMLQADAVRAKRLRERRKTARKNRKSRQSDRSLRPSPALEP